MAKAASNVIFEEDMRRTLKQWNGFESTKNMVGVISRWWTVMSRVFIFSNVFYYGMIVKNYWDSWYDYFWGQNGGETSTKKIEVKTIALAYSAV